MKISRNNNSNNNLNSINTNTKDNFTSFNKNDVTFKKEEQLSEDFFNKIESLKKENLILEEKNLELEDENLENTNLLKKFENDLDQITQKYNTLTAKHNALLVYSTDIQKKLDLIIIDNNEKKEEILKLTNSDWGKLLNQRDNLIKILKNELNYYKSEVSNLKSNKGNTHPEDNNSKRIESLLENYLQDNKKCKKIVKN
jgi:hypothetical protein